MLEEKPAVLASASGTKGVADAVPAGSGQSKPGGANVKGGDRVATSGTELALAASDFIIGNSLFDIGYSGALTRRRGERGG